MEIYTVFGLEELMFLKPPPHEAVHRFSAVLIRIPMTFSTELQQIFQKPTETQKTSNSQTTLRKKSRAGGSRLPDSRRRYKAAVAREAWCWPRGKTESPERNPQPRGQLACDRGGKNVQRGRDGQGFSPGTSTADTVLCEQQGAADRITLVLSRRPLAG